MGQEIETRGSRPVASGQGGLSSVSQRRGPWILRNERFVRAMSLVGAYVFGAIFLISILAVGVFAFVSVALAFIFLASLAIFFALWALKRRPR